MANRPHRYQSGLGLDRESHCPGLPNSSGAIAQRPTPISNTHETRATTETGVFWLTPAKKQVAMSKIKIPVMQATDWKLHVPIQLKKFRSRSIPTNRPTMEEHRAIHARQSNGVFMMALGALDLGER